MNIEQITAGALALPSEARALLADRLVESLDPAEDGHIHALWAIEAQRRLQDARAGTVQTVPASEAFKHVRGAVAK